MWLEELDIPIISTQWPRDGIDLWSNKFRKCINEEYQQLYWFPDTPNLSDELIQIANKHNQDEEAASAQSLQIKNMLDQYNAIVSFNMKKALLEVCL